MKAIELIRWALQMTGEATASLVKDMHDAPLTRPTPGAAAGSGNHPLWCLGHQTYLEAGIPAILFGADHPLAHWATMFAPGTQPSDDPRAYPPFAEVLQKYRQVRADTLRLLDEIGDDGLDRVPKAVPAGFEAVMKTFGQTILLLTLHNMVHYGQITDARRAAGRKPTL